MKKDLKKYFLPAFILVLIIILFFIFKFSKSNTQTKKTINNIEPTEEIIPTIDNSVKVNFQSLKKGEALLKINNEPKGTSAIDFELSYLVVNNDTRDGGEGQVEQGAIGKCYQINQEWQCGEADNIGGRKIILGTCSSGVCRYHNIVSPIKVVLRFSGDYGQKIFQKEYQL